MRFAAFDNAGVELMNKVYYSVGGGFVVDENATGAARVKEDEARLPYDFHSGADLLALCQQHGISISQIMLENEKVWRSEEEIRHKLLEIWGVMQACVRQGCIAEGCCLAA